MITDLSADPAVRTIGYIFEKAFATEPAGVWRAPGALMLLGTATDALTVALPWGALVAAAPLREPLLDAYSMNHHAEAFQAPLSELTATQLPAWATPCLAAYRDIAAPADRRRGLQIVVHQELPVQAGLLTGAEISSAVGMALAELHGVALPPPQDPWQALIRLATERTAVLSHPEGEESLPFDLAAAGLRLMLIDVAAEQAPPGAAAVPGLGGDVVVAAAALRSGEPSRLGPLLSEAHQAGVPVLDEALAAAWSAGALGGRAVGRCLVVLAPLVAVSAIEFEITDRLGAIVARPPRFLSTTGGPAAGRVL